MFNVNEITVEELKEAVDHYLDNGVVETATEDRTLATKLLEGASELVFSGVRFALPKLGLVPFLFHIMSQGVRLGLMIAEKKLAESNQKAA